MKSLPIDFNGLDTAVHGPIRLGVLTALQTEGPLDFTNLKKRLSVSDGALGLHLKKLEDKDYIVTIRQFIGRRPNTSYQLTPQGRHALKEYLNTLRLLLDAVEEADRR